jgi:hypothetical protein
VRPGPAGTWTGWTQPGRIRQPELHYGSEGWGFESLRACQLRAFRPRRSGLLANGFANSNRAADLDRARKDIRSLGDLIPDHVGVDPQCDGRIGMAQACGHDMYRHTGKQGS